MTDLSPGREEHQSAGNASENPEDQGRAGQKQEQLSASVEIGQVQERLHPSTLFVPILETITKSIIPTIIVSFLYSPFVAVGGLAAFVLAPTAIFYVIRYQTCRFWVTETELCIRSGLIFRSERRIPFDRIQESEIAQSLPHRIMQVARLKITTAGQEAEEASLNVISFALARSLKAHITVGTRESRTHPNAAASDPAISPQLTTLAAISPEIANDVLVQQGGSQTEKHYIAPGSKAAQQAEIQPADHEFHLSIKELILGGLSSSVVATMGAILGAVVYFQSVFYFGQKWGRIGGRIQASIDEHVPSPVYYLDSIRVLLPDVWPIRVLFDILEADTLGKSFVIAVFGLGIATSTYLVRYFGFCLRRRQEILQTEYGLLTHVHNSLHRHKIQALKLEEGLIRRCFGMASIRVDSAGDRRQVDENKKRDVLVPVAKLETARSLALQALPELHAINPPWKKISPLAVMRETRKIWIWMTIGMVQLAFVAGWYTLFLLPAYPLAYLLNLLWYRYTGYYFDDRHFLYRTGWLNRSTLCVPIKNIQSVKVSQNPFDRRLGLARLTIDTAGQSNTGGGPKVRHLPLETARSIQIRLSVEVSSTEFGT